MPHDAAWQYVTRIAPFLTVCGLLILLLFSLTSTQTESSRNAHVITRATIWQVLMSCYLCILSLLSVAFPARALFALNSVIRQTGVTATRIDRSHAVSNGNRSRSDSRYNQSIEPLFIIVIPAYKEDRSTLDETLRVLAGHKHARDNYHVYLAMEERERGSAKKAYGLVESFRSDFHRIDYCIHPQGLAGEVPGKSSNQSWAVKQASRFYADDRGRHIVVTVMDADTHLLSQYFEQIVQDYTANPESRHDTIYMPPLAFDRNFQEVPLLVRTADIMWAGAGISCMYPGSRVCIPTSVYSLSMRLVEHVGGWDVNACAIGEDMHMYLKCFFALHGNLRCKVIFAPASQSNICSQEAGLGGYVDALRLRYQQALRHMWGALDTGYAIRQFVLAIYRRYRHLGKGSTHDKAGLYPNTTRIAKLNTITVFYRLFEAHLLPTHLALGLIAATYCSSMDTDSPTPFILRASLDLAGWCRILGFVLMMFFFHRYQRYHELCINMRRSSEMKATTTTCRSTSAAHDKIFLYAGVLEGGIFVVGGILYGVLPALQAIVSHLFTDRLTYVVSLKSVRKPDLKVL